MLYKTSFQNKKVKKDCELLFLFSINHFNHFIFVKHNLDISFFFIKILNPIKPFFFITFLSKIFISILRFLYPIEQFVVPSFPRIVHLSSIQPNTNYDSSQLFDIVFPIFSKHLFPKLYHPNQLLE